MTIWQKFRQLNSEPSSARDDRTESTIGSSIRIKGDVICSGSLRIEGHVDGSISVSGQELTIEKNSRVAAKIEAAEVSVLGELVGNITATGKIEIGEEGSVFGNVLTGRLVLGEGSTFSGRVNIEEDGDSDRDSWEDRVLNREIDDVLFCAF